MTDQNTQIQSASQPSSQLQLRREVSPGLWSIIMAIAPTLHQSHFYNVASAEQAATIMLRGYELGLSLTSAFDFIHIIDGKPGISPRGAMALIHQSGLLEAMDIVESDTGCTVTMRRKGGFSYTCSFTLDDAKRAGLLKEKSGWEKYPRQMCKWRAIGFVTDIVFSDVLAGMKRVDEFGGDLDVEGNVIESEASNGA